MSNLFMLNETFTNGLDYNVLNIISVLSIFCGVLVIISKNPIVSVLFLIGLFLNIAGYLMILGMNFIGLSYLLVYVGAVSILFLFILMLINVRISELVTDNNNSIPLAIVIGILFNLILYKLIPYNITFNGGIYDLENIPLFFNIIGADTGHMTYSITNNFSLYNNDLSFVSSQVWDKILVESPHITTIGNIMYSVYPIWLIITSIILLLAMVGAIVITIKQ